MSTKETPAEVVTAIELATQAKWPVSNRNGKFVIAAPDGMALTIGHYPNAESLKTFRSTCRRYNLVGSGPARTPSETEELLRLTEKEGLQEAERLNAQRRKHEGEEAAKRRQAAEAAKKADAATAQGMNPSPEVTVQSTSLIPPFDRSLLGTRDNSKFKLADNQYYCIECWEQGMEHFAKAPQGLAAHRGRFHRVFPGSSPVLTQETSRVILPEDVSTAFEMMRTAVAEALGEADHGALAEKTAELAAMQKRLADLGADLEKSTAQLDTDRAEFDKRFLEAQVSADKKLADQEKELGAKAQAEIAGMLMRVKSILDEIKTVIENSTPVQAVGKIDGIIQSYLS